MQVEQDLVVALADCLSTGSNVAHQQLVVSQELQAVHDSLEALSIHYLAGMPPFRNCTRCHKGIKKLRQCVCISLATELKGR